MVGLGDVDDVVRDVGDFGFVGVVAELDLGVDVLSGEEAAR